MPSLPEEYTYFSYTSFDGTYIHGTTRSSVDDMFRTIRLDTFGNYVDSQPYQITFETNSELDYYESSLHKRRMENGDFLYITYYTTISAENRLTWYQEKASRIIRMNADNEILYENTVPGFARDALMEILPDGRIVVVVDGYLCIYNETLQQLAQVDGLSADRLALTPKGELLALTGLYGQTYRIDVDNASFWPETYYTEPSNLDIQYDRYFSGTESAYEAYFADKTGFWGWNNGMEEAELLCNWQHSGMTYRDITVLGVIDENTLLISHYNQVTQTEKTGFLRRAEDGSQKIRITVGLVEDLEQASLHGAKNLLYNAIDMFNAENDTYFVERVDYYQSKEDWHTVPEPFKQAMLENSGADIIISSRFIREEMMTYVHHGAFENLLPVFGDSLLPAVVSAYQMNDGGMYAVPINMFIGGLAAKESVLPAESTLNLDALYALSEQTDEDTTLFNYAYWTVQKQMMAVSTPSFADRVSGNCYYDTEQFTDFINFYESIPSLSSPLRETDIYMMGAGSGYGVDSPEIAAYLQGDSFFLVPLEIGNLEQYAALKLLYGEEDFVLHGYPTLQGERIVFNSEFDMYINADSKVKYGASQFLSYLYSDTLQNCPLMKSYFPVTRSGFELALENDTCYISQSVFDPMGNYYTLAYTSLFTEPNERYKNGYLEILITEDDKDILRHLFYESEMQSLVDTTMTSIIEEELSAYRAGVRSLEETQEILQSRLFIYINE